MYRYIAIERQFCSGGQEVASILAKSLDISFMTMIF